MTNTSSTTSSSTSSSSSTISPSPVTHSLSPPYNPQISIKLSPTNYLLWKAQLQPLLCYHKLIGHVDGTSPAPPITINGAPNSLYAAWYEQVQLVLVWLCYTPILATKFHL
ncbi:hypothetical protein LINGRAHAP2_LOCUS7320 [Linum grandiflorum]